MKYFYARPKTGTGKTAMRVNGDSNEQRNRVRSRVQAHIEEDYRKQAEDLRRYELSRWPCQLAVVYR